MAPLSKRPRGIKQPTAFNPDDSSSAAAAVDEASLPQAKKAKTTEGEGGEEEEADSPEEVWEDAKDLWERAMEAAGESDPSPAIPLLRGIIHEFDRILRNSTSSDQPLDVQPSSTTSTSTGEPYSKEAFYYIYATSLSTLGLLLSQLPQLAHPSEPSPLDFQIAASGFFTQHQPPSFSPSSSSSWSSWKFPLAHARTLVLSASEKLDEDPTDEGAEEHTTSPEEYLKEAIRNFESAIANLPSPAPTSEAASNRDPITTFLHSTLPLQLRLRTLLSIATSIGVLVERIDNPSDRLLFATWSDDLLARVGTESSPAAGTKAVEGSEWEYEVAVGRGAVWLGVAGREAELVEADETEDASKDNLSTYLEKSLAFLSKARELKPLVAKKAGEEVEDELSPMLVEVALTFGLVLDGEGEEEVARREELEELARREGWNGEDEEEEEDGDDEE